MDELLQNSLTLGEKEMYFYIKGDKIVKLYDQFCVFTNTKTVVLVLVINDGMKLHVWKRMM